MKLNRRNFYFWSVLFLLSCGPPFFLLTLAAPLQSSQSFNVLSIKISEAKLDPLEIQIGENTLLTLSQLRQNPRRQIETVQIHWAESENRLEFQSPVYDLEISSQAYPGLKIKVPAGEEFSLQFLLSRQILEMSLAAESSRDAVIFFPDGGSARIIPGGKLRFDYFRDGSFYWTGSTGISGISSDGEKVTFTSFTLPVQGGPLEQLPPSNIGPQFKRLTPLLPVKISGSLESSVQIQTGENHLQLYLGERRELQFPNGTRISLWLNPDLQALQWQVEKGFVQFGFDSINSWRTWGRSGQAGYLQWNNTGFIGLKNLSPGNLLVQLPESLLARLEPNSFFQVSKITQLGFEAVSVGAPVLVRNTHTGENIPLENKTASFLAGTLSKADSTRAGLSVNDLRVYWEFGKVVQIQGPGSGRITIAPNSEQILQFGEDRVSVSFSENGELRIVAVDGNFQVHFSALNDLRVKIPQSNSAVLNVDRNRMLIRTSDENNQVVQVQTPSGANPQLQAGKVMQIRLEEDGTFIATSDQRLLTFEPAGSDPLQPSPRAPVLLERELESPRVEQAPASVF